MSKIVDIERALDLVKSQDTVAFGGLGLTGYAEYVAASLERRFLSTQAPKGLTIIGVSGQGDRKGCGADHFVHPEMVHKAVMGHFRTSPAFSKLCTSGAIQAFCLPQGVLLQLFRAAGAGQPGVLTEVGLGTYMDPRLGGGRVNDNTRGEVAQLMCVGGKEYLFYPTFPIHVAVIRGTTADEEGNITIEREALKLEIMELALAARATHGKVIAQVERLATDRLKPKDIAVPAMLVDAVVVAPQEGKNHWQTLWQPYSPLFSGEARGPVDREPIPMGIVKLIAQRACQELRPGAIVNIGMGISGAVSPVASELGLLKDCTFTIEMGAIGGEPVGYPEFAAMYNPASFLSHVQMFDYYHGHGCDITFLGAGEVDEKGNVNVSRLGPVVGQGGFIDITYKARNIVFCLEFMGGAEYKFDDGKLTIINNGKRKKFVRQVSHITFSGERVAKGQTVKAITERTVMELRGGRWTITEIAPGIDMRVDVLPHMDFLPEISNNLITMDGKLFR